MRRLLTALIALSWGCSCALAQVPFEWQAPGAQQTYSASRYYTLAGTASATGAASTANVIACAKGQVYAELTFSVLTLNITTIGTSNVQIALYADTGGLPGALLASAPSVVNTSTLGVALTLSSSVQVGPGSAYGKNSVWYCTNVNDSSVVFTGNSRAAGPQGGMIGAPVTAGGLAALVSAAANEAGITCSGANCNGGSSTFGTWPATLAGSTWTLAITAIIPMLYFQPLSVP